MELNRRSFFNKCAIFVAGCALAIKVNFKDSLTEYTWENAPYELAYLNASGKVIDTGALPIRFYLEDGKFIPIFKFINE